MEDVKADTLEDKTLGFALVLYSTILLVAFAVGLYGLFSLLWIAGDALEQSARTLGMLY
jgi:hypothetical protein